MANYKTIDEILDSKTWIDYFSNREIAPLLGDTLFPLKYTPTMKFEYLKGSKKRAVTAHFHAFNTESEIASRKGAEKEAFEVALIKRKIGLDEELLKKLSQPRSKEEFNGNIMELFDDVEILREGVRARVEASRFEALQTGIININENGMKVKIDYGMPSAHRAEIGLDWTKPDADILGDLKLWSKTIYKDSGKKPTKGITSEEIISCFPLNKDIRKAMYGVNADQIPTDMEISAFFKKMGLPTFITYDEMYQEELKDGKLVDKRYFDENRVVIFADAQLGDTMWTETPEHNIIAKDPSIKKEDMGNILIMSWLESRDPVGWWTKAVTCALPSFPMVDQVFSAKVF